MYVRRGGAADLEHLGLYSTQLVETSCRHSSALEKNISRFRIRLNPDSFVEFHLQVFELSHSQTNTLTNRITIFSLVGFRR